MFNIPRHANLAIFLNYLTTLLNSKNNGVSTLPLFNYLLRVREPQLESWKKDVQFMFISDYVLIEYSLIKTYYTMNRLVSTQYNNETTDLIYKFLTINVRKENVNLIIDTYRELTQKFNLRI